MANNYAAPPQTRIGYMHLKVSDLQRALNFYCGFLDLKLQPPTANRLLSYPPEDITPYRAQYLEQWRSAGARQQYRLIPYCHPLSYTKRSGKNSAAFDRWRISAERRQWSRVSEPIYLDDLYDNGVELYWDRPKEKWTYSEDGSINMFTKPLDLQDLLGKLSQ